MSTGGGWPYSPKSSSRCRGKRSGDDFLSHPTPVRANAGAALVAETRLICNLISSLTVWTSQWFFALLSGVGGFVLGFLILVSFSVGGFSPTEVSSPDGRLHFTRSPVFVPHHTTCHSCGVNKKHYFPSHLWFLPCALILAGSVPGTPGGGS